MLRSLALFAPLAFVIGCSGATSTELFGPASTTTLGTSDADSGTTGPSDTPVDPAHAKPAADAGADAEPASTCKVEQLPLNPNDACDACDLGACCGEIQACDQDFDCRALVDCLGVCGQDKTCQQACTTFHADSMPELMAFASCQKKSCVAQCGQ